MNLTFILAVRHSHTHLVQYTSCWSGDVMSPPSPLSPLPFSSWSSCPSTFAWQRGPDEYVTDNYTYPSRKLSRVMAVQRWWVGRGHVGRRRPAASLWAHCAPCDATNLYRRVAVQNGLARPAHHTTSSGAGGGGNHGTAACLGHGGIGDGQRLR